MRRVLAAVALLLTLPIEGFAQETPKERAKAYSNQGLDAVDSGDFLGAIDLFKKAYRTDPRPKYLYNVGRAYHIMGKFKKALEYYERFLSENTSEKKAKKAQATIDELKRQMARLMVAVEQTGARLEVDGDKELCVLNKPCLLDPGEHRVEVLAKGFAPQERRIRLEAGEMRREEITLVAVLMEELPTRGGAVWRSSLFPGMGQFYADNKTAGIVFLTTEIVALATMTTGIILEQYYLGQRSSDKPENFSNWNSYIDASYYTWVGGLAAAGTIWAVNIVHAAAMRLPTAGDSAASAWLPLALPTHNGLSLTFTF